MEDVQDTVETEEIQEEVQDETIEKSVETSVPEVGEENYTKSIGRQMSKLRRRAQEAETKLAEVMKERVSQRPARPNPNQYEQGLEDPEYLKAQDIYEDAVYNWRESQRTVEKPPAQDERIIDYFERVEASKLPEKYPDFYEVTQKDVYNVELADALYDDEKAGELAYYLGKHPTELKRMNHYSRYDPEKMDEELGKLKKRLFVKQASSAPNPISPVSEEKGNPPKNIDEIKDDEEWYKAKQEERRRKIRGG